MAQPAAPTSNVSPPSCGAPKHATGKHVVPTSKPAAVASVIVSEGLLAAAAWRRAWIRAMDRAVEHASRVAEVAEHFAEKEREKRTEL